MKGRLLLPRMLPGRLSHMTAERGAEGAGRAVANAFGHLGQRDAATSEQFFRHRHAPGQQVFHGRQAHGA